MSVKPGDDKARGTSAKGRRAKGFRHVGGSSRVPLDGAARKMGFAETDVLIHWPEIVGSSLAGLCHPVGVSYGKARAFGATLIVRVDGARAPEAEMMGPQIVERVNAHYGYRAVSRMKITQATGRKGSGAGFAEPAAVFAHAPAEPDPRTVKEANALCGDVRDPGLRDALSRMGAYVMSRKADQTRPARQARSEET